MRNAPRGAWAQAMVEMGLLLPVFLILTLGLIDVGRAMVMAVNIQDAAGSAAHYGSLQNSETSLDITDQTIGNRVVAAAAPFLGGCTTVTNTTTPIQNCTSSDGTWNVTINEPSGTASGAEIEVKVVGDVAIFGGFSTGVFGLSLNAITVQGDAFYLIQ